MWHTRKCHLLPLDIVIVKLLLPLDVQHLISTCHRATTVVVRLRPQPGVVGCHFELHAVFSPSAVADSWEWHVSKSAKRSAIVYLSRRISSLLQAQSEILTGILQSRLVLIRMGDCWMQHMLTIRDASKVVQKPATRSKPFSATYHTKYQIIMQNVDAGETNNRKSFARYQQHWGEHTEYENRSSG